MVAPEHDERGRGTVAFEDLIARVRAWDDRRPATDRGALDHITPESRARAAGLVRSGRIVGMGRPWDTTPGPQNRKPALHYMSNLGGTVPHDPEPTMYCDFIGTDFHDKAVTHIDALCHIAYQGRLFGGREAQEALSSRGMAFGSAADLGPVFTRAVLLDMARSAGVQWVEPGTAWTVDDVERALAATGTEIGPGDAVLLRSGAGKRRRLDEGFDPNVSPGLHASVLPWFAERQVAIIGADDTSDARPSPIAGISLPVHTLAIAFMGVPLLDNLDLEELSTACEAEGRWEFLFVVAVLNIPGGTGSPVNPVGVF